MRTTLSAQGQIPSWQPPRSGLGFDVDLDLPEGSRPHPILSREVQIRAGQPLFARILFSWASVEREKGILSLEVVEKEVDAFREAGFEVILVPRGGNAIYGSSKLPLPGQSDAVAAWRVFLRSLAQRFEGKVRFYEISDAVDAPGALGEGAGAREYAFLLKNAAAELRGADPEILVVTGSVSAEHLDFLQAMYAENVAAYVDVVALRGEEGVDPGQAVERFGGMLLQEDPSASVWLVGQPLPRRDPVPAGDSADAQPAQDAAGDSSRTQRALEGGAMIQWTASALSSGAHLVLFALPADSTGAAEAGDILVLLRRLYPPSLGPSSEGVGGLRWLSHPGGEPLSLRAWRFFDASTFQVLLVYVSPAGSSGTADLILDTADVSGAVIDDLVANTEKPVASLAPEAGGRAVRLELPLSNVPMILRYQRFATPGYLKGPESTEVNAQRELTAEEILARHQEFQADQDGRLLTVMATARISYHYTVASAEFGVDVTTLNNFYWDRIVGAEWEQKDFFFNGVRWTGKKPPDLPLIQPEKVVILPLDIHLNKDYTYRLLGHDKVADRDCYLLEFSPVPGREHLYRGKVWIDAKSFARVRISSVQEGLTPPVTSNDEVDSYGPAPGSGTSPLWVLQRIDGQQRHSLAGVNLIVIREVEFSDFVLNAADFDSRRKAAYDSQHVMMRDTEKGFRYLDRGPGGERVVRSTETRSTTLGAVGLFRQQNLDYPVIPLLGIDYFSFDFHNSGNQVNLFFAGALLQGSFQNPHLGGTKLDAGISVLGVGFSTTDRYYVEGEQVDAVAVKQRSQDISFNLGYPLGNFFTLKALASVDYNQYGHSEDAAGSFVVPSDNTEYGFGVLGQFDRRGWTVQGRAERFRRNTWEPWGDRAPASPAVGSLYSEFNPDDASYNRYRAQVSKQIILPLFQKVILHAEFLTGTHLDRFSEYQLGFFDTRVRGFSGSGVRFDRGASFTAGYQFNLGNVIRLGGGIDWARVRNSELGVVDPSLAAYQRFTGVGLTGNFMGPWNTLFQFDYGIAVQSDIPSLKGGQEFELVLFKFF